jgi:Transposase DDE domain/Domain of unknown function (DUF4372)
MEQESTFSKYLNPLFVKQISEVIKELRLNRYVKKLDIIRFIKLFIYAQLNQISSLQDISLSLNENQSLQKELGISSISASQLSRKLRDIDSEVFRFIFRCCVDHIMKKYDKKVRKKPGVARLLCLIDASTISLCISKYPWAKFRNTKAGVKIHLKLIFSKDITAAENLAITPARCADKTQMDELISIDKECLYVFDRGYIDYKKFDDLCKKSVRFVTRLKSNAAYEVIKEIPVSADSSVTYAAEIKLGSRSTYVMKHHLILIETKDSKGKIIRIITNDFKLGVEEISEIYKNRWQVELFFKWIKQHLNVKKMYGTSQNAVYNQLYIALITHCLLVILQICMDQKNNLLQIYKYIQLYWHKSFNTFLKAISRPKRHSKGRGESFATQRIFEETLQQYENGDTQQLDQMDYDPVIA